MADNTELVDGPLLVSNQLTTLMCHTEEMACRYHIRQYNEEQVQCFCGHPDLVGGEGWIPSNTTPKFCPNYPSRERPSRRSVRPVPSREKKEELVEQIFKMVDAEEALKAKTNTEVADLLVEHVWGELNMFGSHSILIGEAIERLRKDKDE